MEYKGTTKAKLRSGRMIKFYDASVSRSKDSLSSNNSTPEKTKSNMAAKEPKPMILRSGRVVHKKKSSTVPKVFPQQATKKQIAEWIMEKLQKTRSMAYTNRQIKGYLEKKAEDLWSQKTVDDILKEYVKKGLIERVNDSFQLPKIVEKKTTAPKTGKVGLKSKKDQVKTGKKGKDLVKTGKKGKDLVKTRKDNSKKGQKKKTGNN